MLLVMNTPISTQICQFIVELTQIKPLKTMNLIVLGNGLYSKIAQETKKLHLIFQNNFNNIKKKGKLKTVLQGIYLSLRFS